MGSKRLTTGPTTNQTPVSRLAIDGGAKAFDRPFPARQLYGEQEKRAAMELFDRAIETGGLIGYGGEAEQTYCRRFADFMGGGYCDAVNSGTSAVYVALRAAGVPAFTEVIVPPITDPGGIMPVPLMNCIPIVADTDLHSYNVGPEQIADRLTEHTRAIVVAHFGGSPVDRDPVLELARPRGIKVIEDCAQAHGSRYKGRLVDTIGDIAAFSTMDGKHHCTAAQGGVVFTRDEAMALRGLRRADRGKPFGLEGTSTNVVASLNLNTDNLSAAVGIEQLKKLPRFIEQRRRVARAIGEGIASHCRAIRLVADPPDCASVFWFLLFDVDPERTSVSKQQFADAVAAEGLPFAASYVRPQTEHEWFRKRAVFEDSQYPWSAPQYKGDRDQALPLPNFEAMDQRLCWMSFHENLTDRDVADIVAAFEKVDLAYGAEAS